MKKKKKNVLQFFFFIAFEWILNCFQKKLKKQTRQIENELFDNYKLFELSYYTIEFKCRRKPFQFTIDKLY